MTIDEGIIDPETFAGRKWEATISPAADARGQAERDREQRKAAEQEKREGEHRERLLGAVKGCPEGETERRCRMRPAQRKTSGRQSRYCSKRAGRPGAKWSKPAGPMRGSDLREGRSARTRSGTGK